MTNLIKATIDVVSKYHFTNVDTQNENHSTIKTDLPEVHGYITVWLAGYDNDVEVTFYSNDVLGHKANGHTLVYSITDKKSVRKLCTRARNFMKKLKKQSEIYVESKNDASARFAKIQTLLVERKVAFAFDIRKAHEGGTALITINGYTIRVKEDLMSNVRVGMTNAVVPIEQAIDIANLLPENK